MGYDEEQMREVFFQEMHDVFEHIDSCILLLEKKPNDIEIIRNLFREVHTLKGSSGVFGLREISDLTHHAEDLLDNMREGKIKPHEDVFSVLLKCFDRLKEMMACARNKQDFSGFENQDLINQLSEVKNAFTIICDPTAPKSHIPLTLVPTPAAQPTPAPAPPAPAQPRTGGHEFHISITNADQLFLTGLDPSPILLNCRDIATEEFTVVTHFAQIPMLDEMESEHCYFEFEIRFFSSAQPREVEDIFEFAMAVSTVKIGFSTNKAPVSETVAEPAPLPTRIPEMELQSAKPQPDLKLVPDLKPIAEARALAQKLALQKPLPPLLLLNKTPTADLNEFVRMKKERLTQLMNLVGELITVKNLFVHLALHLDQTLPDSDITRGFKEGVAHITRLSSRLQESVMKARMVPVGSVFTKYTRLVRDVSKKLNKKVNLVIEGEDTELDKTVSEAISDPIMHLIRNCIDHGIETPEVRRQRGKPETGTLLLKASYEGHNVKIVAKDDGNGVDTEKVKAKAIEFGLITKEQAQMLTKKDIIEFIFHSGFSTAVEVSDVSGRGVGLDVVRNSIQKSCGSIFVETIPGQGTEFKILLPLSLAVVEALLVGIGEETYAIPQDVIIETVRVDQVDIMNLNSQPSINLRGEVIPVLKLREVILLRPSILDSFIQQEKAKNKQSHEFSLRSPESFQETPNIAVSTIVIVQIDSIKAGILVDALYWQEQIMIKPLGGFLQNIPIFTGACIMGNGSVVLVIEPKELYMSARVVDIKSKRAA